MNMKNVYQQVKNYGFKVVAPALLTFNSCINPEAFGELSYYHNVDLVEGRDVKIHKVDKTLHLRIGDTIPVSSPEMEMLYAIDWESDGKFDKIALLNFEGHVVNVKGGPYKYGDEERLKNSDLYQYASDSALNKIMDYVQQ